MRLSNSSTTASLSLASMMLQLKLITSENILLLKRFTISGTPKVHLKCSLPCLIIMVISMINFYRSRHWPQLSTSITRQIVWCKPCQKAGISICTLLVSWAFMKSVTQLSTQRWKPSATNSAPFVMALKSSSSQLVP